MTDMSNDEKINAIEGVMEGATFLGNLMVATGDSAVLGDIAKSALAVIEEILAGEYSVEDVA